MSNERGLGEVLGRLAEDAKTLAKDQLRLTTVELNQNIKEAAVSAAAVVMSGLVVLIGVSMLCVAGVVALGPVIDSLAVRLVLMAVVYGVVGTMAGRMFGTRLQRDLGLGLPKSKIEAKETVEAVSKELSHV
jgi:ABC-type long-subunit fatty acid transport system fused permease/ATPase subunit